MPPPPPPLAGLAGAVVTPLFGGLGIQNPTKTADREYQASKRITSQLTELIFNQDQDLSKLDRSFISKTKADLKMEKEISYAAEKSRVESLITSESKRRAFSIACEKGSSSWLSALPLRSLGYCLNKKDFQDSLSLRYNWPIPDVPKHCACGKTNSVDHALSCKKGGYVTFRHDILVETEAELLLERLNVEMCAQNLLYYPLVNNFILKALLQRTEQDLI